jgi:hypothetical protein
MKHFIMAASLFLIAACNAGPSKDEFREIVTIRDNVSYTEIVRDNHTNIQVTTTTSNTNTNNSSTTSSSETSSGSSSSSTDSSSSTPTIQMMNSNLYSMSAAAWAVGTMPTLTFYIEGESKKYQINQNGLKPEIDNFTESETGFFTYTVKKNEMILAGADVYTDNTSNVFLKYKTNIYTFVTNKYETVRYEMAPIEFVIRVN